MASTRLASTTSRGARTLAYEGLQVATLQEATDRLEAAGVVLAPGFEDFAELCSIRQVCGMGGMAGGVGMNRNLSHHSSAPPYLSHHITPCPNPSFHSIPTPSLHSIPTPSQVRLYILTHGLKPVVRHFLRKAGLGHIEVLGNDLSIGDDGAWRVLFRDDSPSGERSLGLGAGWRGVERGGSGWSGVEQSGERWDVCGVGG